MTWKAHYKGRFYSSVTAESQYQAIDMVFTELVEILPRVNRRDIVVIPENKVWKKATAQKQLFGFN
jgi:hypothetical protein